MRKWKCSVCGYIHTGDDPPETCPVCGADRSKFMEISEADAPPAESEKTLSAPDIDPSGFSGILLRVAEMVSRHHLHPIFVHIPNGVLPVAVVLLLMSVVFGFDELGQAAFYNLLFVVLSMPAVLISGVIDWKKRYSGTVNRIFITK